MCAAIWLVYCIGMLHWQLLEYGAQMQTQHVSCSQDWQAPGASDTCFKSADVADQEHHAACN